MCTLGMSVWTCVCVVEIENVCVCVCVLHVQVDVHECVFAPNRMKLDTVLSAVPHHQLMPLAT